MTDMHGTQILRLFPHLSIKPGRSGRDSVPVLPCSSGEMLEKVGFKLAMLRRIPLGKALMLNYPDACLG